MASKFGGIAVEDSAPSGSKFGGISVDQTPVEKQNETPISDVVRPITDVGNRALVAGTLGAPVDLATMALRPFGYKEEKPTGGSEWIGQKMQDLGLVTPKRRPVAETLTQLAPSIVTGGALVQPRELSI